MNDARTLAIPSLGLQSSHQRRLETLTNVLQSLDALVFLEAASLYYLDASVVYLLLRAVVQVSFVSPRPAPLPANPQIFPVLGINLLCLVTHILASAPQSSEGGSYGYIHGGGVLVDFVGTLSPVSKWSLVSLDIILLVIQLVMLGLQHERARLKGTAEGETTQDLEAEESGTQSAQNHSRDDEDCLANGENGGEVVGWHSSDRYFRSDYMAVELDIVQALSSLAKAPAVPTTSEEDRGVIAQLLTRLAHDRETN